MKILLFSDLHFSFDRYGLYKLKLKLLRDILERWHDIVDVIVSLGDTDNSRSYDSYFATKIAECWDVARNTECIELSGNHNSRLRKYTQLSSYAVASDLKVVTEKPLIIDNCVFQGWNNSKLPDLKKDFYFGHLNINDLIGKGISFQEIEQSSYKKVFFGDYHEHFERNKAVSVGTLFPSSFNDQGYQGSFLIFDSDSCKLERFKIPNKVYPQFVTVRTENDFDNVADNIVRLELKEPNEKSVNRILSLKPFKFAGCKYVKEKLSKTVQTIKTRDPVEIFIEEAKISNWTEQQLEIVKRLV